MNNNRQFIKLALAFILVLAMGTAGYMFLDRSWSFLDSLYMTIITITTIGYGEIHELETGGRIFTILLIFMGIGLAASLITRLGQIMIESGINNLYGKRKMTDRVNKLQNHFIICGYGRIGSSIALKLFESDLDFVIIEKDEENMEKARLKGFPVLLGDACSDASLLAAGISRSKGTVLCMKNDSSNINIALAARELNTHQSIIARGSDPSIEYRLIRAGADTVVYPMKLGGEQIARLIADSYDIEVSDENGGAASVLGYQLKVFKNLDVTKSVKDLLNKSQAVRPVAIRHGDGSMTHNPRPGTEVRQNEELLILVNEDKNNRTTKSVNQFSWNNSLTTGISQIDDEHRLLFKYASDFQISVKEGHGKEAVAKVFDLLISYTETHFRHEEQLMLSHEYPDYEHHHSLHRELTRQVIELNRDRRYIFSDSIWDFLDHWLTDHILETDKKLADYIKRKEDSIKE